MEVVSEFTWVTTATRRFPSHVCHAMPREILDLSVSLFLVTHFIILYSLFGCVALFAAIKTAMKQRLWAWSDVMIYKRKQAKM